MRDQLVWALLILLLILLLKNNTCCSAESFGVDNKPFEPDNMLLNRNPWDDIDYIVPVYRV